MIYYLPIVVRLVVPTVRMVYVIVKRGHVPKVVKTLKNSTQNQKEVVRNALNTVLNVQVFLIVPSVSLENMAKLVKRVVTSAIYVTKILDTVLVVVKMVTF